MKCTVCEGHSFCLCERLTERKPIWNREPGGITWLPPGKRPIDQALEDTQRLMDEMRKEKAIRAEALRMAQALVKLLEGGK